MKKNNKFVKLSTTGGVIYVNVDNVSSVTILASGIYVNMVDGKSVQCEEDNNNLSELLAGK